MATDQHPKVSPIENEKRFGNETKHNNKRRAVFHDYCRKGLYMLTLVVKGRRPLFGHLIEHPSPYISYTDFGKEIHVNEIPKISRFYPNTEVWKICIMPDHIHMIVYVKEDFEKKKHLGLVVSGFKMGCNRAYWKMLGQTKEQMGSKTPEGLFEAGYNDRLLLEGQEQLKRWKEYLADNPRRLMLKRKHPDLFRTVYNKELLGVNYQLYGNMFLLNIPDKLPVIVHRADDDATFRRKKREWLACGERGGVLIGTAISPREREVIMEAIGRGYNVIRLCDNGFSRYYKPSGGFIDACAEGRLLEMSPNEYRNSQLVLTREACLGLNKLAEGLAGVGALL